MQLYVPPAQRRGKGKSETKKIARCAEDVVAAPTVAVECDKAESEVVEMMEKGCVLSAKVSRETVSQFLLVLFLFVDSNLHVNSVNK